MKETAEEINYTLCFVSQHVSCSTLERDECAYLSSERKQTESNVQHLHYHWF